MDILFATTLWVIIIGALGILPIILVVRIIYVLFNKPKMDRYQAEYRRYWTKKVRGWEDAPHQDEQRGDKT